MSLKARVGLRIREIRKQRGLTQETLAEKAERSVDGISALERGLVLPGFETLERLAEVLDVPLASFFDVPGDDDGNQRAQLLVQLMLLGRALDEDDLQVAVELVSALTRKAERKGRIRR
jgi:transcriptional regulator with XRE-family HTH domain